jgi:hypothetical protein
MIAAGHTTQFYHSLRWPGWENETRTLPLSHGITVYPFLWSEEAHRDLAGTTRRPVPLAELLSLQEELAAKFAAEPDTTTVQIRIV